MKTLSYSEHDLPVLWSGDVVVIGASLAGITAALGFARAGKKTSLVEPRTYPGRDLFTVLRPWLKKPVGLDLEDLPEIPLIAIEASGKKTVHGEYPLHPDMVKLRFEDLLLEAGVKLLYASQPVGVVYGKKGITGVVVGNKSGRQVLECRMLVDATETALLAHLVEADFEAVDGKAIFSTTVEFYRAGKIPSYFIAVPAELGVEGNQVEIHKGYRGGGHLYAVCQVRTDAVVATPVEATRREYEIRDKAIKVAAYLKKNITAFGEAKLTAISHEAEGRKTSVMKQGNVGWAKKFEFTKVTSWKSGEPGGEFALSTFAGPKAGLWVLGEGAAFGAHDQDWMADRVVSCQIAEVFVNRLLSQWEQTCSDESIHEHTRPAKYVNKDALEIREPEYPQKGRAYPRIVYQGSDIPVVDEVEVLVVGGGSSGAVAGIIAAQLGAKTALVDMNPGLGGTGTFGGVDSYWCGYRGGVIPKVISWVDQVNDELGFRHMKGLVPLWKIEVKIHAFLRQAYLAGMDLILNAKVIGSVVEENRVRGVILATALGPMAMLGKVVIDATGDGDVAAFAGVEYLYGSERDHATMWFAYHQVPAPGVTRNNFTSSVDVRNVEDYTRAILSGRRRGRIGMDHDHMTYIAPRETRHIIGDEILNLNDHMLRRSWQDVVYIAFSNNDIKGQISSDWFRMGLIPPHLEIEVPYGALLPKGLECILVTGKAVSTTHDSLAAIRMQSDMENLGAATAAAAVKAVRESISPRKINVGELQAQLVKMDLLPEGVLSRKLIPITFSEQEIKELIDSIDESHPLYAYSDMRLDQVFQERIAIVDVVTAGEKAIPILEEALAQAEGERKVLLAQMLAAMGAKSATPVLVAELLSQLSGEQLPTREHEVAQVDRFAPDQAAMPVTANLLYSLGMIRDRQAIPVWQRVVDLLKDSKEEDITSQEKAIFHYVDAVCVGVEQLGDPAAAPILKQLHNYPAFHGKGLPDGFQANYLKERQAYLEVVISRSMARCGSPDGVVVLIDYLTDARGLLAEQAHDELEAITGKDFGKDVKAWTEWLEAEGENLKPKPWEGLTEVQSVWGKELLTTEMKNPRKAFGRDRSGYQAIQ
jgi:flavin-dependent dehydrogenase